jgi:hypothetical protein
VKKILDSFVNILFHSLFYVFTDVEGKFVIGMGMMAYNADMAECQEVEKEEQNSICLLILLITV